MNTICSNCHETIGPDDLFCANCGMKIEEEKGNSLPKLTIRNNQSPIVRNSLLIGLLAFIITLLSFYESSPLYGMWFVSLIGVFAFISALVVAFIFKNRAKKLDTLLSGEKILSSWRMDETLKTLYVDRTFQAEKAKNKILFAVTAFLVFIIFGIFIIFIDEGKSFMAGMMVSLLTVLAFFAFGMPNYHRNRNLKGDGWVLIGEKFVYVNGFFHNWDFPLSGLTKAKAIQQPFYGLQIDYYYTDRTLTNKESLIIPAPKEIRIQEVANLLK